MKQVKRGGITRAPAPSARYLLSEYLRRLASWVSPSPEHVVPPHPAHVPVVALPAESSGVMIRTINGWLVVRHERDMTDERTNHRTDHPTMPTTHTSGVGARSRRNQ